MQGARRRGSSALGGYLSATRTPSSRTPLTGEYIILKLAFNFVLLQNLYVAMLTLYLGVNELGRAFIFPSSTRFTRSQSK